MSDTIAMADDKTQMMDKTDLPLHTEGVDRYVERRYSLIFFHAEGISLS